MLAMTEEALVEALVGKKGVGERMPDDVRVVGVRYTWNGLYQFKLVSRNFDGPYEGDKMPWLTEEVVRGKP